MGDYVKVPWTPAEAEKRMRIGYGVEENPTWSNPASWSMSARYGSYLVAAYAVTIKLLNWYKRRPAYAGLAVHVPVSVAIYGVGYSMGKFGTFHFSTREAVVEHYMQLHPEEFDRLKTKNSRKFGDLLLPWFPHRTMHYTTLGDPATRLHRMDDGSIVDPHHVK